MLHPTRPIFQRVLLLISLVLASAASARPFAVPAGQGLTLEVVKYDGDTNGTITVRVSNPSAKAIRFDANGLHFIPDMSADLAPQRLGAVGPFRRVRHGRDSLTAITVEARQTIELELDVYCIDSHRPSPDASTPFRLAKQRLPKQLTTDIVENTHRIANENGGYAAPTGKSAVQSEVWKQRDKKWIKIEGEGKQEQGK